MKTSKKKFNLLKNSMKGTSLVFPEKFKEKIYHMTN